MRYPPVPPMTERSRRESEAAAAARDICDFCQAKSPAWECPARDFVMFENHEVGQISRGGWAACDLCKPLVERRDRRQLAARAAKAFAEIDDAFGSQALFMAIQQGYWDHADGPPVPGSWLR